MNPLLQPQQLRLRSTRDSASCNQLERTLFSRFPSDQNEISIDSLPFSLHFFLLHRTSSPLCNIHVVASHYETLGSSPSDSLAHYVGYKPVIRPTSKCMPFVVVERDQISTSLNNANCRIKELEEEIVNDNVKRKA